MKRFCIYYLRATIGQLLRTSGLSNAIQTIDIMKQVISCIVHCLNCIRCDQISTYDGQAYSSMLKLIVCHFKNFFNILPVMQLPHWNRANFLELCEFSKSLIERLSVKVLFIQSTFVHTSEENIAGTWPCMHALSVLTD